MTFYGYKRPDGRVGVRNHVLILVVFNQYLETILHLLQCCCSQRQESYLLSVQTLESMSIFLSLLYS